MLALTVWPGWIAQLRDSLNIINSLETAYNNLLPNINDIRT